MPLSLLSYDVSPLTPDLDVQITQELGLTDRQSFFLDNEQTSCPPPLPKWIDARKAEKWLKRASFLTQFYGRDKAVTNRISRLWNCCSDFFLYADKESGEIQARPSRCMDKLCPICAPVRSARMRSKIEYFISQMAHPRLWTFTLKNMPGSPREMKDRIIRCWQLLKRTKLFKGCCKGGVWVCEYTFNISTGTWHFHLHLALDALFMPWEAIRDEWNRITGDSFVVHFHKIQDKAVQASYIASYISEGAEIERMPPGKAFDYLLSMKGSRDWGTFGSAYSKYVPDVDVDQVPHEWEYLGRWSQRMLWVRNWATDKQAFAPYIKAILQCFLIEHDIGAMMDTDYRNLYTGRAAPG